MEVVLPFESVRNSPGLEKPDGQVRDTHDEGKHGLGHGHHVATRQQKGTVILQSNFPRSVSSPPHLLLLVLLIQETLHSFRLTFFLKFTP